MLNNILRAHQTPWPCPPAAGAGYSLPIQRLYQRAVRTETRAVEEARLAYFGLPRVLRDSQPAIARLDVLVVQQHIVELPSKIGDHGRAVFLHRLVIGSNHGRLPKLRTVMCTLRPVLELPGPSMNSTRAPPVALWEAG